MFRTTNRGQDWERITDLYRVPTLTVDPDDSDIAYVATDYSVH